MKIICIGNATWDRIYNVTEIPSIATKYFASSCLEMGGGVAATAAVAVARSGAETFLISRIGNDAVGQAIKNELREWGVDCSLFQQYDGRCSSNAVVHVNADGERQITVYRDAQLPDDAQWMDASLLEGVDGVLCDCTWSAGALRLLELARERGVPSVVDVDLGGENIAAILQAAGHVAFSWPALCALTGETEVERGLRAAQQHTDGVVYVTRGEEGCWWLEAGVLCHVPAYSVNVVDTTGAGDVFHGALIFALARGQSSKEAVRYACATAALKCTRPGGRPGIPDYQQTLDFINTQRKE
ncbi:ribokinase [Escherichia fergusonii]|nr:ribokinase [Escherichia fergusonii]